jgi:predicted dehydrogenase
MSAAAQKHNRVVAEAFMYRHHPQTLKVREIVQSGALGQLKIVRGTFSFVLSDMNNVRAFPEMGGGSIWDVGCYPISYARFVLGTEPLEVFGRQVTGPTLIDETFVGQMEFPNGIHMQFDSSFAIQYRSSMEFVGTEATLAVPMPFKPNKNEKLFLTRGDKTETIKIKGQELYIGEVEDMADCILNGKAPHMSLADSRANINAIVALLESARTGQPIKL